MTSLTLWGRRSAFNVQKVLWALGELELGYDHHEVGGSAGGLDSPEFLALNPRGRIPVLVDDGVVLWESHAILRYLGAQYASDAIWPNSPVSRAAIEPWMDWAQTTLQPDFMRLFWGFHRTPVERRDAARIGSAIEACDAHFRLLDAHLAQNSYLGGSAFSLADVPAGTTLYRYFEMGADVARPPHVMAWYARLSERRAFRTHIMTDFEALRGRQTF